MPKIHQKCIDFVVGVLKSLQMTVHKIVGNCGDCIAHQDCAAYNIRIGKRCILILICKSNKFVCFGCHHHEIRFMLNY